MEVMSIGLLAVSSIWDMKREHGAVVVVMWVNFQGMNEKEKRHVVLGLR